MSRRSTNSLIHHDRLTPRVIRAALRPLVLALTITACTASTPSTVIVPDATLQRALAPLQDARDVDVLALHGALPVEQG